MRKHNDFSGVGRGGRREYIVIRNRDRSRSRGGGCGGGGRGGVRGMSTMQCAE